MVRRDPWRKFVSQLGMSCGLLLACALTPCRAQAGEVMQRVLQSHKLRACIWPGYYSISYRSPRTQQLSGIDIDLAKAFAHDLGVTLEFVETTYAKLIDDLRQDRCDVAMFGIGVTPERQAKLDFSAAYLQSGIYALVSRSSRVIKTWADIDQPGVRVGMPATSFMTPIVSSWLRKAQAVPLQLQQSYELELESGRVDVFMVDFPFSQYLVANADWVRRLSPPKPLAAMPYAYAVKPGDEAWLQRLNEFVSAIKRDGRLATAAQKNGLAEIMVRH